MEQVILAAGCFWGIQYYFDQIPGVVNTTVGYTGGVLENPTYEDVCYRQTGHAEALLIEFDTSVVSYQMLLHHFFRIHDPTQLNRQGPDVGDQYRSAIFYNTDTQLELAKDIINELQISYHDKIVTELMREVIFYRAEDYHQKYTEKTGRGMCHVAYEPLA